MAHSTGMEESMPVEEVRRLHLSTMLVFIVQRLWSARATVVFSVGYQRRVMRATPQLRPEISVVVRVALAVLGLVGVGTAFSWGDRGWSPPSTDA